MKHISITAIVSAIGLLMFTRWSISAGEAPPHSAHPAELRLPETDLLKKGVFGFPQEQAQVVCDTADLRLSVWNNSEYLYIQAVLWKDNDFELDQTPDGRAIGDHSDLTLDLDADEKMTKDVDRIYLLNPWPNFPGLRHTISKGAGATTAILSDSKGRGSVRYIQTPEGRRIRVDSFLIPLKEISRKVADKIRLAYYGDSPRPELTVNSVGYEPVKQHYYSYNIPLASYHDYFLIKGTELSISSVPDGRHDSPSAPPRRH